MIRLYLMSFNTRTRPCSDPSLAARDPGLLIDFKPARILSFAVTSSAPTKSAATTSAENVLSAEGQD